MDRQFQANLADRGWINPSYYNLGSTDRMYYPSRTGGRAILDYGIQFAEQPWDWLQLGYASYLGSFVLMNTGTAESNYGYWFRGKENDGAIGWDFNSGKGSMRNRDGKIRKNPHGIYPYCGEADLGLGVIMRTASTVITNDPHFGWIAYGGNLEKSENKLQVIPQDGLGVRFGLVTDKTRILAELNRDRYSKTIPIVTDQNSKSIMLTISNITGDAHKTRLKLTGTKGAVYKLELNGKNIGSKKLQGAVEVIAEFIVPAEGCTVELVRIK